MPKRLVASQRPDDVITLDDFNEIFANFKEETIGELKRNLKRCFSTAKGGTAD